MCLLQRFLFLSIHRLYLISFLREILMEKVLQEFLGCIFLGAHTIQTTKTHLHATLAKHTKTPLFNGQIDDKNSYIPVHHNFITYAT